MDYLDFDLEITRLGPDWYRATVHSPAGEASVEFAPPFSELELENFILRMGHMRTGTRRLNSQEMEAAEKFGRRLFEAVFQGEVRDLLTSSLSSLDDETHHGLRIRLHLAATPELNNWPWEYLYHPSLRQFVVLSTQTPLIRYLDLPRPPKSLAVTPPLRVLVMISDPKDYTRLNVASEKEKIAKALKELEGRGVLKVEWLETATLAELQRRLRKPDPVHIFHFIGHGGWNPEKDDGYLLFTDDYGDGRKVGANNLAAILGGHKPLRLAVLNACEGARGSITDPFAGTAATLVNSGLPAVLAMQFEISDRAAIQLAQVFYESLADGLPVEGAVAEARKMIFADGNDVEWGTPVLYLRAKDGKLFELEKPLSVLNTQIVEKFPESPANVKPLDAWNDRVKQGFKPIPLARRVADRSYGHSEAPIGKHLWGKVSIPFALRSS
ncbi:MAG TPA: CHAT domain-containing protein [Anaerolineales bacterium]|nr:CHAT domain-containing protein [Anaerolineales bacterium]